MHVEALAGRILANAPPYNDANVRHTLLEGAARAKDWEAYERHRAAYAELCKDRERRSHGYWEYGHCEILNLDGLTALARGRDGELPRILAELIESARNVPFLGTPDTMRLVKTLLSRGEHVRACRDYLQAIDSPDPAVLRALEDVEAQLSARAEKRAVKRPASAKKARRKGKKRKKRKKRKKDERSP